MVRVRVKVKAKVGVGVTGRVAKWFSSDSDHCFLPNPVPNPSTNPSSDPDGRLYSSDSDGYSMRTVLPAIQGAA